MQLKHLLYVHPFHTSMPSIIDNATVFIMLQYVTSVSLVSTRRLLIRKQVLIRIIQLIEIIIMDMNMDKKNVILLMQTRSKLVKGWEYCQKSFLLCYDSCLNLSHLFHISIFLDHLYILERWKPLNDNPVIIKTPWSLYTSFHIVSQMHAQLKCMHI